MDRELALFIDFGGQYNQLIARRVRECGVYCEIYSYKNALEKIKEKNPKGIIMYTPDGYMSAQLMSETRKPFASGDWFNGTPEEYIDEASTYIAYSGRFMVDEKQRSLKHEMQVSLFPNWIGNLQPRAVSINGNQLTLGTVTPIMSKGKKVMSKLIWERVEKN